MIKHSKEYKLPCPENLGARYYFSPHSNLNRESTVSLILKKMIVLQEKVDNLPRVTSLVSWLSQDSNRSLSKSVLTINLQ